MGADQDFGIPMYRASVNRAKCAADTGLCMHPVRIQQISHDTGAEQINTVWPDQRWDWPGSLSGRLNDIPEGSILHEGRIAEAIFHQTDRGIRRIPDSPFPFLAQSATQPN
jgi:hypothetical protein